MENNVMPETKKLLRDLCDGDDRIGRILRKWFTLENVLYMDERIKKPLSNEWEIEEQLTVLETTNNYNEKRLIL